MASVTTLKSTDLICAGHLDTLSSNVNTQFLKQYKFQTRSYCQCAGFN